MPEGHLKKMYEFCYQDDLTGEECTHQLSAIGIEHAEQLMIDWLIEEGHGHLTYLSGPSLCTEQEATEPHE